MSNIKGIVVGPSYTIEDGITTFSCRIDSAVLKKYLLYWDNIAYPVINGFGPHFDLYPDLEYLHSQGVLLTESIQVNPADINPGYTENIEKIPVAPIEDIVLFGQLQAVKNYLANSEIWSIAQSSDSLRFSSTKDTSKNILELRLFECLPVPDDQVSFDDIINFRISHTDKLNNLRVVLEKFREKVISSVEPDRKLVLVKEELNEAIQNIDNSMDRYNINHFFDTLNIYLNVSSKDTTTSALGALLAYGSGVPIEVAACAGASAGVIIKAIEREVRGAGLIPKEIDAYMYLYTAKKHGITA